MYYMLLHMNETSDFTYQKVNHWIIRYAKW